MNLLSADTPVSKKSETKNTLQEGSADRREKDQQVAIFFRSTDSAERVAKETSKSAYATLVNPLATKT